MRHKRGALCAADFAKGGNLRAKALNRKRRRERRKQRKEQR